MSGRFRAATMSFGRCQAPCEYGRPAPDTAKGSVGARRKPVVLHFGAHLAGGMGSPAGVSVGLSYRGGSRRGGTPVGAPDGRYERQEGYVRQTREPASESRTDASGAGCVARDDGVAATQAIAGRPLLTVKGMVELPLVACPGSPGALLVVKIRSPSGLVRTHEFASLSKAPSTTDVPPAQRTEEPWSRPSPCHQPPRPPGGPRLREAERGERPYGRRAQKTVRPRGPCSPLGL